jgi:vanillate O-demethylase monooxygenase subunit
MYPFTEGSFAPKNGWYVAAFAKDIGEALLSRWILNHPVVLYRKSDGTAVAVEGRCPHRHFPLGQGRRVGDAIQCGYHGITFDSTGKCTFMPSQTTIPGVYSIRTYPLVERGLWAWIWPGDPRRADESLIPTLEEIGYNIAGQTPHAFFTMDIPGRYQLLNDNLLDLSHISYLHAKTIGTPAEAAAREERDVNERRISSRRNMSNVDMTPVLQEITTYRGPTDRVIGMDFFFPGFHAGIGEHRIAEGRPRGGELLSAGRVWHAITPATRNTSTYFFAMSLTSMQRLEQTTQSLRKLLDEDILATVEIEKILTTMDQLPPELILRSDATAVIGRRILQSMIDRERAGA